MSSNSAESDPDSSLETHPTGAARWLHRALSLIRTEPTQAAALLSTSHFVAGALGLVTSIVIARIIGPMAFGIAALVMAYPEMLRSWLSVKSFNVLLRYLSGFEATERMDEFRSLSRLGYLLDGLTSLVILVLVASTSWLVLGRLLHLPRAAPLAIVYAASFLPYSLLGTSSAMQTAFRRFSLLSGLLLLERVLAVAVTVPLVLMQPDFAGVVVGTAIAQSAAGLIAGASAIWTLRVHGLGPWWGAPRAALDPMKRELRSLFSWNFLFQTLDGAASQLPLLLVGAVNGPREAGLFRLAWSFSTAGQYIEASLTQVGYPSLAAAWAAGNTGKVLEKFKQWTRLIGVPVALLLATSVSIIPILIPKIVGPQYIPMVPALQILICGVAVSGLFFALSPTLFAVGRFDTWTKGYAIYAAIVVSGAWLVAHPYGFLGVAALMAGAVAFFKSAMALLVVTKWDRIVNRDAPAQAP